MFVKDTASLEAQLPKNRSQAVIWLLCHYPDTAETTARVQKAVELQKQFGLTIWLFGSSSARYPSSVEKLIGQNTIEWGGNPDAIRYSVDFKLPESLDTVQEAFNVFKTAEANGITHVICVSNLLQLLQVSGFGRKTKLSLFYVPTSLRDWRWWYVSVRIGLVPLAFLGIGRNFPPLILVRRARDKWPGCPF